MSVVEKFKAIDNIAQLEIYINACPKGSLIFVDVDETILTPKSNSFRINPPHTSIIQQIRNNKKSYRNFEEILSNWRLSRKVILVEEGWPGFIDRLKEHLT